jgi:hypothetical protein
MAKAKKKLFSLIKSDTVKSKIIPYSFSLLSLAFIIYILINIITHYVSKYGQLLLNIILSLYVVVFWI